MAWLPFVQQTEARAPGYPREGECDTGQTGCACRRGHEGFHRGTPLLGLILRCRRLMHLQEMADSSTSDYAWRVGPGYISLDDLYLLEIHQVAKASLQPVIVYRPRAWPCQ